MKSVPCAGYIRHTGTTVGYGVFASNSIDEGQIVEICPLVLLRCSVKDLPLELRQRVFDWAALAGRQGVLALALGYGSVYNHANPANLRYVPTLDGDGLCFVAAASISAEVELTVNYNGALGGNVSTNDNWFQSKGIVPIARSG